MSPLEAALDELRKAGVRNPIVSAHMGEKPHYLISWEYGRAHQLRVPMRSPSGLHPSWTSMIAAKRVRWLVSYDKTLLARRARQGEQDRR